MKDLSKFVKTSKDMLHFIEESPSCFHAAANLAKLLGEADFKELKEQEAFAIENGGKYFVIRNGSSILAFTLPKGEAKGFHITAAHSDSPCFKVKEKPEMEVEKQYVKLNVEKYGGMIDSTWLDRPLSVAGRVVVKENDRLVTKLVSVDRDLLVIPNVAIHMNRDMNKGMEYNAQTDLLPLYGGADSRESFEKLLAKEADADAKNLLGYDMYLYTRQKGVLLGADQEFILAPRLDDLQCAYGCMRALTESEPTGYINVCVVFDNEEIGSGTKQGADSTFLSDTLKRIWRALGGKNESYRQALAESFAISADNAHAVHPNHPEKADPTNRPYLNGGIVIKFHGSQRYTTDAVSAARMKDICKRADVPYQTYHNRSDIPGGSTLGNISTAHVSVDTVDIGLAQLAMHSACETAGVKDTQYLLEAMKCFYKE